jgi:hypothetical protein
MKWEAKVIHISGETLKGVNQLLAAEGAEGWEPFACDGQRVYFKRPAAIDEARPPWEPAPGTLAHAFAKEAEGEPIRLNFEPLPKKPGKR